MPTKTQEAEGLGYTISCRKIGLTQDIAQIIVISINRIEPQYLGQRGCVAGEGGLCHMVGLVRPGPGGTGLPEAIT